MIKLFYSLIFLLTFLLFACGNEEEDSSIFIPFENSITNEFEENYDEIISDYKNYSIVDEKNYSLEKVDLNTTFENPWAIEFIDDNQAIITEKKGRLVYVDFENNTWKNIQHNIPSVLVGQGGLLDILNHEDFLYVSFSKKNENNHYTTAIGRGKLSDDYKNLYNFEIIFEAQPYFKESVHFGSRIVIHDNHLYASIGERGKGKVGQELDSHAGSIIRINLDGTVPDNPFNEQTNLKEIFMIGVRNPQGMTKDNDGNLLITNHGAKGGDFIGFITSGGNYGWNKIGWGGKNYSGTSIGNGESFSSEFNMPLLSWVPSIAPSDLIIYEGDEFFNWSGDILVTSLKYKLLLKLELEKGKISNEEIIFKDKIGRLRDVEVNSKGEIFLITDEKKSEIWKLISKE